MKELKCPNCGGDKFIEKGTLRQCWYCNSLFYTFDLEPARQSHPRYWSSSSYPSELFERPSPKDFWRLM